MMETAWIEYGDNSDGIEDTDGSMPVSRKLHTVLIEQERSYEVMPQGPEGGPGLDVRPMDATSKRRRVAER